MQVSSVAPSFGQMPQAVNDAKELNNAKLLQSADAKKGDDELRKAFDTFVGETFYGQMLKEMRKTVGKSAYFDGGRAEEIFSGQLDQQIATSMAKANGKDFTGPMYELFSLNRK